MNTNLAQSSIKPVQVQALNNYKLWIEFEDSTSGVVDLSHLVGNGVYKNWQIYQNFQSVRIDEDSGDIMWRKGIQVELSNLYRRARKYYLSEL